jgi:hypothetical protein
MIPPNIIDKTLCVAKYPIKKPLSERERGAAVSLSLGIASAGISTVVIGCRVSLGQSLHHSG